MRNRNFMNIVIGAAVVALWLIMVMALVANANAIRIDVTDFALGRRNSRLVCIMCKDKWESSIPKKWVCYRIRKGKSPEFEGITLRGWIKNIHRFEAYVKRHFRRGKRRYFIGVLPGLLDEDGTWWYAGLAFRGAFRKIPKSYAVAVVFGEEYNHLGKYRIPAMADTMCHEGAHGICNCEHIDNIACIMNPFYGSDNPVFCGGCIETCKDRFGMWKFWRTQK